LKSFNQGVKIAGTEGSRIFLGTYTNYMRTYDKERFAIDQERTQKPQTELGHQSGISQSVACYRKI
jgi:hypothetical protein